MEHDLTDFEIAVLTMGEGFDACETGFVLNVLIDMYPNVQQWRVNTKVTYADSNDGPRHVHVAMFKSDDDDDDDDDIVHFSVNFGKQDAMH